MWGLGKKKEEKKKEEKKEDKKEEKKEDKKEDRSKKEEGTIRKGKSSAKIKEDVSSSPKSPKRSNSTEFVIEDDNSGKDEGFTFARLVDSPLFSDVSFFVGQPPHKISAHACILEVRCPSLLKNAKKKKTLEVEIPSTISHATFMDVLGYLYTNKVNFDKLKDMDVVLLLSACAKFEGLERLKFLCEAFLKKELDVKNAHRLLKAVDDLQLPFKEYILHFAVQHYTDFIGDKTANKDLGINLFQDVVALYQEQQAGKLKPLEEAKEPKDTFIEDFKALYDSVKLSDINFKLAENNAMGISGTQIRGHKAIIVGRGPGLSPVVNQATTEVSKGVFAVTIKGISPEAFESVLRWVYYDETHVPTLLACELVGYCKQHHLVGLQLACVESMRKGIQVDTVLKIMDAAYAKEMPTWYEEKMREIIPNCVQFAAEHIKEIDFEKLRKMSKKIAPEILIHIQQKK